MEKRGLDAMAVGDLWFLGTTRGGGGGEGRYEIGINAVPDG